MENNRFPQKSYVVNVYTSNKINAGTDAKVFICLYNSDGQNTGLNLFF